MSTQPRLKELTGVLEEIVGLLVEAEEGHWASWMRECKDRLVKLDYGGIEHLLRAYGGMGSFNDLILGPGGLSGELGRAADQAERNDRLSQLRSRAWDLARDIQREQDKSGG